MAIQFPKDKANKSNLTQGYVCPLTKEIMIDPLMNKYGESYERSAIIDWITVRQRPYCPKTKLPLTVNMLVPNHKLRNEIMKWREMHGDDTSSYNSSDTDTSVLVSEVVRAINDALSPQKKNKKKSFHFGTIKCHLSNPRHSPVKAQHVMSTL